MSYPPGVATRLYNYMFPRHSDDDRPGPTSGIFSELPTGEGPCPSCTALMDMWDGTVPPFRRFGWQLAIVAKAPIERVAAFAQERGGDTPGCCRRRTAIFAVTTAATVLTPSLYRC